MDEPKIVHFQILGGSKEDVKQLALALNKLKKKADVNFEFLVTDDKITLHSVKYLIDELYKLYRSYKEVKEVTVEKIKNE